MWRGRRKRMSLQTDSVRTHSRAASGSIHTRMCILNTRMPEQTYRTHHHASSAVTATTPKTRPRTSAGRCWAPFPSRITGTLFFFPVRSERRCGGEPGSRENMALPDNYIWEDLTVVDVAICATATLSLVAYVGWRWRMMQAEREAKLR